MTVVGAASNIGGSAHRRSVSNSKVDAVLLQPPIGDLPFTTTITPITFLTQTIFDAEISAIGETLQDLTSNEWDTRTAAMHRLAGIVLPLQPPYDADLHKTLRGIRDPLVMQLSDLRSAVCREACATLSLMAARFGTDWESHADVFVPALLKLVTMTVNVIAVSADMCIRSILSRSRVRSAIARLVEGANSNNAALRVKCMEYVGVVLQTHETAHLERHAATLAELITSKLSDRTETVRQSARRAYWELSHHWQDRAQNIRTSLNGKMTKLIDDEKIKSITAATQQLALPNNDKENTNPNQRLQRQSSAPQRQSFVDRSLLKRSTSDDSGDLGMKRISGAVRVERIQTLSISNTKQTPTAAVGAAAADMTAPALHVLGAAQRVVVVALAPLPPPSEKLAKLPSRVDDDVQSNYSESSSSTSDDLPSSQRMRRRSTSNTQTLTAAATSSSSSTTEIPKHRRSSTVHLNNNSNQNNNIKRQPSIPRRTSLDATAIAQLSHTSGIKLSLTDLLNDCKHTDWNIRVEAFNTLKLMFSTNESMSFNNDVIAHTERCIYTHIDKLSDPHHKVLTAAIQSLSAFIASTLITSVELQSYLDVIFSALFTCLTHVKLSIRQLSNDQLNVLASMFQADSIIPVLLRLIERSENRNKIRMGAMEFLVYLIPRATEYLRTPYHIRMIVTVAVPSLFDAKEPKLRQVTTGLFALLQALEMNSLTAAVESLSPQVTRRVKTTIKSAATVIETTTDTETTRSTQPSIEKTNNINEEVTEIPAEINLSAEETINTETSVAEETTATSKQQSESPTTAPISTSTNEFAVAVVRSPPIPISIFATPTTQVVSNRTVLSTPFMSATAARSREAIANATPNKPETILSPSFIPIHNTRRLSSSSPFNIPSAIKASAATTTPNSSRTTITPFDSPTALTACDPLADFLSLQWSDVECEQKVSALMALITQMKSPFVDIEVSAMKIIERLLESMVNEMLPLRLAAIDCFLAVFSTKPSAVVFDQTFYAILLHAICTASARVGLGDKERSKLDLLIHQLYVHAPIIELVDALIAYVLSHFDHERLSAHALTVVEGLMMRCASSSTAHTLPRVALCTLLSQVIVHQSVLLRKQAVSCYVALFLCVGDDLTEHLSTLPTVPHKLVQIYIQKAQHGTL